MSHQSSLVSDSYIYEPAARAPDGHTYRTEFQTEASSYELGSIIRIPFSAVERGFINVENSWLNLEFVTGSASTGGTSFIGTGFVTSAITMSYIGGSAAFDAINLTSGSSYVQNQTSYQSIFALNYINNLDTNNALPNSITNHTEAVQQTEPTKLVGQKLPRVNGTGELTYLDGSVHMSIPLLGLLSGQKSIPLGMLSSEIVLEIYVTNDIKNVFYNNQTGGTLTGGTLELKCSMDCQIEVVSPNAFREIKAATTGHNGIVSWSATEQRASSNHISAAELNVSSLMEKQTLVTGVMPRKLLSMVCGCFKKATGTYDAWAVCQPWDETEAGLQWMIGTKLYPPRRISTKAEILRHLQACYNQDSYTTQNNRFAANKFTNRIHDDATSTSPTHSCFGIDLTSFDKTADGVDVSNVNILVGGNLKLSPLVTETVGYTMVTVKRFGVLYSISPEGDWVISY